MIETQEIDNHSITTGRYSPDFALPKGKDWLFRHHHAPDIGENWLIDLYVSPDKAHVTLTDYHLNIAEAGLTCGWGEDAFNGVIPKIPYMVYHMLLSKQNPLPWLIADYIDTLEHVCTPIDEGSISFYAIAENGAMEKGVPLAELSDHQDWSELMLLMQDVRAELLVLGSDGLN